MRPLPVLVALAFLVAGCFKEPAAPAGRKSVDARFLGVWDCTSADTTSKDRAELTVLRFDAEQYYAEWKEDEKVDRYRAYHGTLKGLDILNIVEVSDSTSYWFALRVSMPADGSMSLAVPARRITDISDDEVRLRTFRRQVEQPDAWQAFARCVPDKE